MIIIGMLFKDFCYESSWNQCNNLFPKLKDEVKSRYSDAKEFLNEFKRDYYKKRNYATDEEILKKRLRVLQKLYSNKHGK